MVLEIVLTCDNAIAKVISDWLYFQSWKRNILMFCLILTQTDNGFYNILLCDIFMYIVYYYLSLLPGGSRDELWWGVPPAVRGLLPVAVIGAILAYS